MAYSKTALNAIFKEKVLALLKKYATIDKEEIS
jgi:hypothetical protein